MPLDLDGERADGLLDLAVVGVSDLGARLTPLFHIL